MNDQTGAPTPVDPRAWAAAAVRCAIGGLLLFSSYLKLSDLDSFINALDAMQLPLLATQPAWLYLFADSLPWFELGLGALLLSGVAARASALFIDEAHHINSKNKTKYKGFSEKEIQGLNTFASVIRSMKSAKEEKTRFIEMSATQVIY